ncbi:MAG TPA: ATP-binding protein [Solirubrobacteraceae bacterium]
MSETYPAVPESVPRARRAVSAIAAAAGASGEQLDAVRLAVSEAVTNAVKHAYPGRHGPVEVSAAIASEELWLLVADDGCGLRADRPSAGRGLGLALIALLSDGLTITKRSSGGIELHIRFKLAGRVNPDAGVRSGQDRASDRQSRGSAASATPPASRRFATTT